MCVNLLDLRGHELDVLKVVFVFFWYSFALWVLVLAGPTLHGEADGGL